MDITTASVILANLRDRIEIGDDGKYRLAGIITSNEVNALEFVLSEFANRILGNPDQPKIVPTKDQRGLSEISDSVAHIFDSAQESDELVILDTSTLALPESESSYRVCMDFGTAMSKATFVRDDIGHGMEDIEVLKLGIPGDQELIDEIMLVSSVFIDSEGLLWFGQHAVERAQVAPEGSNSRIDNIKRALSEDNIEETVSTVFNPTSIRLIYEEIVLAYLTFFTWTINCALFSDVKKVAIPRNFRRRFAMPCFPRASARKVESKLKMLLGEAQVLADTFRDGIHTGLSLKDFFSAVKQLRAQKRTYSFVDSSVTEPLGVAGSLLSWRSSQDSLVLVVDIGAGTSDFCLYRLNVVVNESGVKATAGEVEGTARGITEAGNHLDKILMALILKKSGVDASHPKYRNVTHALERDIRFYKESLFSPMAGVAIPLYTGEMIDVTLDEFLAEPAVKLFENSLRSTLIEILESAHRDWIDWVRSNPSRRLTIVLTGGGATLPMAKELAVGYVTAHGITIPVAPAKSFPDWLRTDYPDLESHYPRVAVSLGGARKNTLHSIGVLRATGIGLGGYQLERAPLTGN